MSAFLCKSETWPPKIGIWPKAFPPKIINKDCKLLCHLKGSKFMFVISEMQ